MAPVLSSRLRRLIAVAAVLVAMGCATSSPGPRAPTAAHPPSAPTSALTPGSCHIGQQNGQPIPDRTCTPGAYNPAVTQSTIKQTICVSGWSSSVRPPLSKTEPVKRRIAAAYGVTLHPGADELDHLIPLSVGGAPLDDRNFWIEPGPIPNRKDAVEAYLRAQVCSGRMLLDQAQQGIIDDWTQYLPAAGGAPASEEN